MKNKFFLFVTSLMLFMQANTTSAIIRIGALDVVTVAENTLQDQETSTEIYRVWGYVASDPKGPDASGYKDFWMTEELGVKGSLHAYVKTSITFDAGDLVAVTGHIKRSVSQTGVTTVLMYTDQIERNPQHSLWINSEHGSVSGSGSYFEGEMATLRVTPYKGYEFTNWSDGNRENPRHVIVVQDTTLTVEYYKLPTYRVSATCENGQVDGTGEYLHNEQATLSVYPNSGYSFKEWSDGNTTNPRSIIVTKDTLFVAECTINQYNIEVYSSDEKKGTVSGGGTYNYGEKVVLTATPIGNNQFYKWHDGNTENPRTITVYQNTYYRAIFGIKQCNLSVVANDIMGGSVQGGGTFDYGTQVEISAKPNSGYQFLKWSNGAKYNPYTFTIVEDMDLIAFFQKTEAELVDASEVGVTPQDNSVTVVWPAVNGAATYELVVKDKSGVVICTLVFNAQGQLTQIVFNAPGREQAPQQTQSTGFSFTVTGLDEGTSYDLTLLAKNSSGSVLDKHEESFTTTGSSMSTHGVKEEKNSHAVTKYIKDGQLYIINDGKLYNTLGSRVR